MNRKNKENGPDFLWWKWWSVQPFSFFIAAAFLTMTAATEKSFQRNICWSREHMNCQLWQKNGEGEPIGENFEVIFQGKEGEVSEVFAGYKVTDENGDEMIYYKRESP